MTIGSGNWGSAIADIVAEEAALDHWIDTIIHDADANTLSTVVKGTALQTMTGDHNITVYLTEDHVITGS